MEYCKHSGKSYMARYKTANGHIQLRTICASCNQAFGAAKPQKGVDPKYIDSLPLIETEYKNPPCKVCGEPFTALHHWLPQSIAKKNGLDADTWPTDYLCRKCHALWHKLVTPTLLGENWNG